MGVKNALIDTLKLTPDALRGYIKSTLSPRMAWQATGFKLADAWQADRQRIAELEKMLKSKLDLIRCGVGSNYGGNPFCHPLYLEAKQLVHPTPINEGE